MRHQPAALQSTLDLELQGFFFYGKRYFSEKISLSCVFCEFSKFYIQQIPELQSFLNEMGLAPSKMLLLSLEEGKEKVLQKCILEKSRAWVFSFGM